MSGRNNSDLTKFMKFTLSMLGLDRDERAHQERISKIRELRHKLIQQGKLEPEGEPPSVGKE